MLALLVALMALAPCDCVAFRLDDIQDYYDRDAQMAVIGLFRDYNATLTAGVIGGALGHDAELVRFLQDSRGRVELANHGWLHEDFSALPAQEQARLLGQTGSKMEELFGARPVTFIAPFNRLNGGTAEAASSNGLKIISADLERQPPSFDGARQIWHLPVNANVSDYDEEKMYWQSFDNGVVLSDIESGLKRDGYAMVMLHPRDFVDEEHRVDPLKMGELAALIGEVRSRGLKVVTVSEIANMSSNVRAAPDLQTTALAGGASAAAAFYLTRRIKGRKDRHPL